MNKSSLTLIIVFAAIGVMFFVVLTRTGLITPPDESRLPSKSMSRNSDDPTETEDRAVTRPRAGAADLTDAAAMRQYQQMLSSGGVRSPQGNTEVGADTKFARSPVELQSIEADLIAAARERLSIWTPGGYDRFAEYWAKLGRSGRPWWNGQNGDGDVRSQFDELVRPFSSLSLRWDEAQARVERAAGHDLRENYFLSRAAILTWSDPSDQHIHPLKRVPAGKYHWEPYSSINFRSPESDLGFVLVPAHGDEPHVGKSGVGAIALKLSRSNETGGRWVVYEIQMLVDREWYMRVLSKLPR